MVVCKQCQKENSLDSRFCRSCGIGLPDDQLKAERLKLEDLVAEGYRLFSAGNTDEALLIAEAAVKDDPSHSSAISLKGMAFERQGRLAEALECYERVLEINPDSALDRIKVTHLRNALASHMKDVPAPSRKTALVGAVAATVLIACFGAAAAIVSGQKTPVKTDTTNLVAKNDVAGWNTPMGQAKESVQTKTEPPLVTPPKNPGDTRVVDPYDGRSLPGTGEVEPVKVRIEGPIRSDPPSGERIDAKRPEDPDPEIDRKPPEPDEPKEDPGVIMIKRSSGGAIPVAGSGSQDTERVTDVQKLNRAAREQFQLGKFEPAANLYEQALRAGAQAGLTNQRLGQCYENLGKKGEAAAAYTRAANAFEAALRSGEGGAGVQNALDSCRQALKALQGG